MHGGYYPVGGASEIARTLLGTVAAAGGIARHTRRLRVENGRSDADQRDRDEDYRVTVGESETDEAR